MSKSFWRFSNTGMYVDFIVKQLLEYFIRNVFVYTALFFGEKFIIEFVTKKAVDRFIFVNSSNESKFEMLPEEFFLNVVSLTLYALVAANALWLFI